jgi:hypothetical protein
MQGKPQKGRQLPVTPEPSFKASVGAATCKMTDPKSIADFSWGRS